MTVSSVGTIIVAGDVCLDVVGLPVPPAALSEDTADNWRQTGETRTYYLPGGAMLLESWIQAAAENWKVHGVAPCLPSALSGGVEGDQPLSIEEFLKLAERVTREEVVHSLIALDAFPSTPKSKDEDDQRIRVRATHGFSGPEKGDPNLRLLPSQELKPRIIVLDDTGNRFRRCRDQWPIAVMQIDPKAIVVYKLHRPLPVPSTSDSEVQTSSNKKDDLWSEVSRNYVEQRVVIISAGDLRALDVPISRGLSWERTAMDVVWQLLHTDKFAELRQCPHLIVRLGLDGAVYWRRNRNDSGQKSESGEESKKRVKEYEAWLIYDPAGIEGTGATQYEGEMVGYGSAFTAALVGQLAKTCLQNESPAAELLSLNDDDKRPLLVDGIVAGLNSTRRLLAYGYGAKKQTPSYPTTALFTEPTREMEDSRKSFTVKKTYFACSSIPIFPSAHIADISYWRLLESIFRDKEDLLHKAVELTATGARLNDQAGDAEERAAARLLKQVPIAVFAKALRTYDRHEIENYRALYSLMLEYISKRNPPRPLSVAVFGPPGAGKSFGVKQVAKALGELGGPRPIETLTFNLSQYQSADQLARAFHLVRDYVLQGKIPLVFFDEFDAQLGQNKVGWLRYFLAPMQDAEFLDQGTPHPIGQAIFVFAGGTCSSYAEFAKPFLDPATKEELREEFRAAKGPDFLSRLRGSLDIPGLDLNSTFDTYGPMEEYPCEAAILLRRAGILAHQLGEKAPHLRDSSNVLQVSSAVLRALLHLPQFIHGNRSFEALLDMSHLSSETKLTPSLLPSTSHIDLHANPMHLGQLISTDYPFPAADRKTISQSIHQHHLKNSTGKELTADEAWQLASDSDKDSSYRHAQDIANKLRAAGLWFRRARAPVALDANPHPKLEEMLEALAIQEHDRWVASKRCDGYVPTASPSDTTDELRLLHNCLFRWEELSDKVKQYDRDLVRTIPEHLAAAGYEIFKP